MGVDDLTPEDRQALLEAERGASVVEERPRIERVCEPDDLVELSEPVLTDDDGADTIAAAPDGYRLTDSGNAARLVEVADGRLRYVHTWGKFIVYQGGPWVVDERDAIVSEVAKGVARKLLALSDDAELDPDKRKRIFACGIRAESSGAIAAMVKLARGAPGMIVGHEQLDADPHLLCCLNGVVDLRVAQLLPHDPEYLCTLQTTVGYDPAADAPLWRACLERWQPDPEMRDYLQLEAGAAATGIATETMSAHYGSGGNGKSKFWGAVQDVLGDYATTPHKSLLVTRRHEQHETVKADLFRKRLAVASETKAADVLDDEQIKSITGGDRMRARRMREDPWFFWPSHTLVLFTNYKPHVQGRDRAMWRRVRLIPWTVTIPDDEVDEHLAAKLRAEGPGILRWVVEGARRFLADGFTPPPAVQDATAQYRNEQDHVGRFMTEALRFGSGWTTSAVIADEVGRWCADQGLPALTMNDVADELKRKGCTRDRKTIAGQKKTVWSGVALAADDSADQGKR
jgi:putative DNA primase/helicase